MWYGVWGIGYEVWGYWVWGIWYGGMGMWYEVWGYGVLGMGYGVLDMGYGVQWNVSYPNLSGLNPVRNIEYSRSLKLGKAQVYHSIILYHN